MEDLRRTVVSHLWVALGGGTLLQPDAERAAASAHHLEEWMASLTGIDKPSEDVENRRLVKEQYFELGYKVKAALVESAKIREMCLDLENYNQVIGLIPDWNVYAIEYRNDNKKPQKTTPKRVKSVSVKEPADPPVGFHESFKPPPRPKGFPGPGHYSCDMAHKALEPTSVSYSIRLKCYPGRSSPGAIPGVPEEYHGGKSKHMNDDTPGPNVYQTFTQFPTGPNGEILRHCETTNFQTSKLPDTPKHKMNTIEKMFEADIQKTSDKAKNVLRRASTRYETRT